MYARFTTQMSAEQTKGIKEVLGGTLALTIANIAKDRRLRMPIEQEMC